jgi:aldehyde:ferredoxin oxidoreductase
MPYGYMGKLLEVNLTTGETSQRPIGEEYFRKYLGGSGVAARIFIDEFDHRVDPLSPENPIIFMNGLLTGIAVPTAAKSSFVSKSPLTGIWNEATVGGHWGEQVKRCGYDGIIITGKSEKPVYLWITDEKVEIRPAEHLIGQDVYETSDTIKAETDQKAVVACIGPAGENQNKIAGIMIGGNETRAAGRGGIGAVMGSKNLKAIAARGKLSPQVKDREKLKEQLKAFLPELQKNARGLYDFGTAGGVQGVEANGDLPIKNWTLGDWAEGAAKTCGQYMAEQGITVSHHACFSCSIRCGKDARVDIGPYAGSIGHGPEYETCAAFGANILNDNIQYLVAANDMCNRFGLDTICTGNAIAMAMECYEHGLITKQDTGGIELTWGNGPAVLEMIKKIAYREGIGEVFADGVVNAAEKIGGIAGEFAVHVKGLSVAFHDPRAFTSMAANYATANRGGCHLEGLTYFCESGAFPPELIGFYKPINKRSDDNKAELAVRMQNFMNTFNALGLCKFLIRGKTKPEDITSWVNAVTGWDLTGEELMLIGERLHNLKRIYNVRLGISRKDDMLPPRLMCHDRKTGAAGGILPHMGRLLSEYYSLRGWTEEGIPTEEKLTQLGLA